MPCGDDMELVARFVRSTKCDGIAHFAASSLRVKSRRAQNRVSDR